MQYYYLRFIPFTKMISTLKFLFLIFCGILGIRNFGQELKDDIISNPLQYSASLFTGMVTYNQLPTPTPDLITAEIIKSFFSVVSALIIFLVVFVAKKITEPLWHQKFKEPFYKFFNLK